LNLDTTGVWMKSLLWATGDYPHGA
jgi:hypothetical protein